MYLHKCKTLCIAYTCIYAYTQHIVLMSDECIHAYVYMDLQYMKYVYFLSTELS